MAFKNKIRLPIHFSRPQYPTETEIYRRTDGVRHVTKSIVSKEIQVETEWMPELIHERLIIALQHKTVIDWGVNNERGRLIRINGNYEIDWIAFMNYPVAPARFKVFDDGFVANNSTCNTCNDTAGITVNDDQFPVALNEGTDYQINAATNDKICCPNPVFSIVDFDETKIDGSTISISQLGLINFTLLAPISSAGNAELIRYEVDCGDGDPQTAGVFGAIVGTAAPACEIPSALELVEIADPMPKAIRATWTPPGVAPAGGYNYDLYSVDAVTNLETLITQGNTGAPPLDINALAPSTHHRLYLAALCAIGSESAPLIKNIVTSADGVGAGDPLEILLTFDYGIPSGGLQDVTVVATITSGKIFDQDIDISGEFGIYGGSAQTIAFLLTIPFGLTAGDSGVVAQKTVADSESFNFANHTPAAVTEQGTGDVYSPTLIF